MSLLSLSMHYVKTKVTSPFLLEKSVMEGREGGQCIILGKELDRLMIGFLSERGGIGKDG